MDDIETNNIKGNYEYSQVTKLLSNKKQIILYGPPGTGKTFLASKYIQSTGISKYNLKKEILLDQRFFSLTIYEPRDGEVRNLNAGDQFNYRWTNEDGSEGRRNWQRYYDEIQVGDIALAYTAVNPKKYTSILKCVQKNKDYLTFEIKKQFDGPYYKDINNSPLFVNSKLNAGSMNFSLIKLSDDDLNSILSLSKGISSEDLEINFEHNDETIPNTKFVTFHPSFGYEDFIEGLRPVTDEDGRISYKIDEGILKKISYDAFNILLNRAGIDKSWKESTDIPELYAEEKAQLIKLAPEVPFYLIIDEINRGDIPRIFGELITLLEADKRYCTENELITVLPYSKNKFSIPPNLYIIGTMNTADKSIALVDIALRRRFGFIEMMPDYDVLRRILRSEEKEIQDVFDLSISVLKNVNHKILKNYDRDHQIGQSYLIKLKNSESRLDAIENLCFIWYYEILPLMQEYFYDSPKKLKKIVGDGFVEIEDNSFICKEHLDGEEFIKALQDLVGVEKDSFDKEE